MGNRIIYTYTFERLNEFKNKKNTNDEILSAVVLANKGNNMEFEDDFNYYIDISNLYKANTEANNILIENILYEIYMKDNVHVILNENSKIRFRQDFATSFDDFKTIQTIYDTSNKKNWDFVNIQDEGLEILESSLNDNLIGHEGFKEQFLKKLKNFPILYKLGEIKIFSILICGNPGVGKTEVARILHKSLYRDSKMIKINLGNYKTEGAINSLIGSPIGFVGSERGGELSNKIRNSDSKIILIDEFEKADTDIFNFFYELLEDGQFTDLVGNEYDLNGYVIIFTTNLSKDNYKEILPPPLLSRFTLKCFFENPTNMEKLQFIEKRLDELLKKYNTEIVNPKITISEIKQNIDFEKIGNISDFRVINRIITTALIKTIDNSKNN